MRLQSRIRGVEELYERTDPESLEAISTDSNTKLNNANAMLFFPSERLAQ